MDEAVGSTIEKIKLLEQDKEAKLKEKRELDGTIATLKKNIHEALAKAEKARQENDELILKTDRLRAKLELDKLQRDALAQQLEASIATLYQLKAQSDQGIAEVWQMRSTLSQTVQAVTNECDIRALLAKPLQKEPVAPVHNDADDVEPKNNDARLREALEKRDKVRAERDSLMMEPDRGEEFVRKCVQLIRTRRSYSNKVEPIDENAPIKFTSSPAAKKYTFNVIRKVSPQEDVPWYQMYSVLGSISAFLIYFCVLREENDLDLEFNKTLYGRIKGLEKSQLLQSYKFNKENGLSVVEIELRLKEIEEEERAAAAAAS